MELIKDWLSRFDLKVKMIYLVGTVLLLQSLFWWFFRSPIMSLNWIIELKFFNLFLAAFLIWSISGKSK